MGSHRKRWIAALCLLLVFIILEPLPVSGQPPEPVGLLREDGRPPKPPKPTHPPFPTPTATPRPPNPNPGPDITHPPVVEHLPNAATTDSE